MKSLDTNILIYAANRDAPEHPRALGVVTGMLASPEEWIIADQVLWEYYKALRHPRILQKPRSAAQAAAQLHFLRRQSGVLCCAYEIGAFDAVMQLIELPRFPYQRTHDSVLGITLRRNGVTDFYTRNVKDFVEVGFENLIDPIG